MTLKIKNSPVSQNTTGESEQQQIHLVWPYYLLGPTFQLEVLHAYYTEYCVVNISCEIFWWSQIFVTWGTTLYETKFFCELLSRVKFNDNLENTFTTKILPDQRMVMII